ncbi:retrotransposon gag domain, Retroviral aspartyl protease [Senna tora]|uniref:Retrotransposon gag domain, Retroviral aspartyl protease n=1 Tax=Senna tora TaxID=362788 RepID=A0A834T2G5_9FABA|nr:retrotransposon gag domain, Retroviral aspartyl protease [Senna tora]
MIETRKSSTTPEQPPSKINEQLVQQLAALSSKLNTLDSLAADVATLKAQSNRGPHGVYNYGSHDKGKTHWLGDKQHESPWWLKDQSRRHHTKMEFPKFEGGDPREWVLKAEKYFRYYQTPDDLKVDIAVMYLEGDALDLFTWLNSEKTMLYWEELVKALQDNYGPAEFQNPDEYLCLVKQVSTVQEYRKEFTRKAARVHNWPEHCLLGVFLIGLKEELRSDVRIQKPRTMYKALSLALEYEAKIGPSKPNKESYFASTKKNPNAPWFSKERSSLPPSTAGSSSTNQNSNSMRSWESERQARRDKGLCFRCGDRFAPRHRCKASLTLLEANNEEQTNVEYKDPVIAGEETSSDLAEISLHTILAWANTKCQPSRLKGLKLVQDSYPFAIGGPDMVLGIKWLASLNTVQANWNDMFMIFEWNGKKYKLQGVQHTQSNSVSLQTFQHLANTEPIPTNNLPHQLQPIRQYFQAIFTEPNILPPYRTHNHSIPLLPNVRLPNIRPYRCPHYQKDEIESQVTALLATGPFSNLLKANILRATTSKALCLNLTVDEGSITDPNPNLIYNNMIISFYLDEPKDVPLSKTMEEDEASCTFYRIDSILHIDFLLTFNSYNHRKSLINSRIHGFSSANLRLSSFLLCSSLRLPDPLFLLPLSGVTVMPSSFS